MLHGTQRAKTIGPLTRRLMLMWTQHCRGSIGQPCRLLTGERAAAVASPWSALPVPPRAVTTPIPASYSLIRLPDYSIQGALLQGCHPPSATSSQRASVASCTYPLHHRAAGGYRQAFKPHICHSAGSGALAMFPADDHRQNSHNGSHSGVAEGWRQYSPEPAAKPPVMTAQEADQMKRELHSLNVAITVNILICLAKVWVHLISGSSAMLAEALHSVADVLNQVLLRVGVVAAMKAPTAQHPYGYMRDRFVWSLISAVGIFFLGAGASVFHGLHTLTDVRVVEGAFWSYLVLGVSALLEGYSLWVAARCVLEGARSRGMALLPYITSGVDPTTVAVMLEDGGAVAGLFIAGVCTALTHWTGDAMFDALGSILVGGLLGLIAVFLVQKNRDLLLGRSMSTKEMEVVLGHLRADPVVLFVTDTKTEELGPRVFRFKAEVAWDGDALVDRYLKRAGPGGRDRLVARLEAALAAERASRSVGSSSRALEMVLRGYGRDIISSVGMEVDRIEAEIQRLNPGIRYVDLETDRGRAAGSWVAAAASPAHAPPPAPGPGPPHHSTSSEGGGVSAGAQLVGVRSMSPTPAPGEGPAGAARSGSYSPGPFWLEMDDPAAVWGPDHSQGTGGTPPSMEAPDDSHSSDPASPSSCSGNAATAPPTTVPHKS